MWRMRLGFEAHVRGETTRWPGYCRGIVVAGLLVLAVLVTAWGAGSARADSLSAPYQILPPPADAYADDAALAVSCPSATQCTAVTDYGSSDSGQPYDGYEVSFDPATEKLSGPGITMIDTNGYMQSVSCPSVTQCTATDGSGGEVTFDPTTGQPNAAGVVTPIDSSSDGNLLSVSCPSVTQCTAVYAVGEVTFDPATGKPNAAGNEDVGLNMGLTSVSCPSLTQCTTVDGLGDSGDEVTFDPATGAENAAGHKHIEMGSAGFTAVVCPVTTQCTAVLDSGSEVTFDPMTGTPSAAGTVSLETSGPSVAWQGLSCLSATLCTAVGAHGTSRNISSGVVSFDPASPAGATPVLDPATSIPKAVNSSLHGVACPSASQCVAVAGGGMAINITPSVATVGTSSSVTVHGAPSGNGGMVSVALSCAASTSGCPVTASLTTTETVEGTNALRMRTAAGRQRTVSVGTRTVTVAAGKTATVTVTLNATGRRLLARLHRLSVRLKVAVSGHTVTTKNLTVKPARSRSALARRDGARG